MRRVAIAIPLALLIGAACAVGTPSVLAPSSAPTAGALVLPKPIPQRITRTGAAAQNAWVLQHPAGAELPVLVGVDTDARIAGRIDLTQVGTARVARSADGAEL